MKYIKFLLHTDYSGAVLTNPIQKKEFEKGTLAYFNPNNEMIYIDDIPVCYINSQVSKEYFCRDDDNQGWLRHAYTYAIAFAKRQRIHSDGIVSRFTEEESRTILNRWKHFTMEECLGVILFNSNFFNATIEDLQQMAKEIHIKIKLDDNIKKDSNNNISNMNENSIKNIENNSVKNEAINNTNNDEVKIVNNVVIKK